MLKATREKWREVARLKARGDRGRVPDDEEIAQRAGYRVRTLRQLYGRAEFREVLRAEEEQVREEIRLNAGARVLEALRNPGEKTDDATKLALTVWDKSRRDGEDGCGCEANGGSEAEARLDRLSDRDLAALAALAGQAEPDGASDAGEDGA